MPRFFFNTQDGESVVDADGIELADVAAAQIDAVKLLGELLREHASDFWIKPTYAVTVTDEAGRTVITVVTSGIRAPTRGHVADQTGG